MRIDILDLFELKIMWQRFTISLKQNTWEREAINYSEILVNTENSNKK